MPNSARPFGVNLKTGKGAGKKFLKEIGAEGEKCEFRKRWEKAHSQQQKGNPAVPKPKVKPKIYIREEAVDLEDSCHFARAGNTFVFHLVRD